MNVVVVMPMYNEAENAAAILAEVVDALPQARIIVVDDDSPDGTADIVREKQQEFSQIELRVRSTKGGLGSAYVETFTSLAERSDVDAVCTIDSDFSHDPQDLVTLVRELDGFDVVVGSRYVHGGRIEGWQRGRHLLSRVGNAYARVVAAVPVHDLTSGLVCFRRTVLAQMPLERIDSSGYAYTIESKCLALKVGARVKEIPITFIERRGGESKFALDIIREGLMAPWRIRFGFRRGL